MSVKIKPKRCLSLETETYEANKENLLAEHEGEYVLIKGTDILGFYPTQLEAIEDGYKKLGCVDIFVKQIVVVEPIYRLGYLNRS